MWFKKFSYSFDHFHSRTEVFSSKTPRGFAICSILIVGVVNQTFELTTWNTFFFFLKQPQLAGSVINKWLVCSKRSCLGMYFVIERLWGYTPMLVIEQSFHARRRVVVKYPNILNRNGGMDFVLLVAPKFSSRESKFLHTHAITCTFRFRLC